MDKTQISNENIKSRFQELFDYLNTGLYEKEDAIRLSVLCAVAGESIFFLGPPGTAKSMVSRRVKNAFRGEIKYFEYLMNEYSTPDEICGPVSLKSLEQDSYIRKTEGFLPTANVVFLDEIWKSGPAILNTLLIIINEKKFHNGSKIEQVPLKILMAASNELPAECSGLEALFDRFIMRLFVGPVEDEKNFDALITGKTDENLPPDFDSDKLISINEVNFWQNLIDEIEVPKLVLDIIHESRVGIKNYNETLRYGSESDEDIDDLFDDEEEIAEDTKPPKPIYISDRRWKKIVRILRASAFMNGRDKVDATDCVLIYKCLWSSENEVELLQNITADAIAKNVVSQIDTESLSSEIEDFKKSVKNNFSRMCKDYLIEEVPQYKASFFKAKKGKKTYWFEVPEKLDKTDAEKVYTTRTICETLDEPVHFAYFTINFETGFITVINPVYRLREGSYEMLIHEREMKMNEIFKTPEEHYDAVQNFEVNEYTPLNRKIKSIASELESMFSRHKSGNANLFQDAKMNFILRKKIDSKGTAFKKLISDLEEIHSFYKWEN